MSLNEAQSLSELRVICAVVGEQGKTAHQPLGFVLVSQNQSQKVETAET